jgi:ABC-2 type transport system permease protein
MLILFKNLKRYITLEFEFIKYCLLREMEFRFNFIITFITIFVSQLSMFLTFEVIYYSVDSIGGWTFSEISFLLATNALIETTFMSFIFFNLFQLPNMINNCELDFILIKPINPMFYISFRRVDFGMLTGGLSAFFIYIVNALPSIKNSLNFTSILIYFFLLINGLVIMYSIFFIMQCLAFYFIKIDALYKIFWSTYDFARKVPGTIYPTIVRVLLTFIIPVLVVVLFPAGYLLKKFGLKEILISTIISTILLSLSIIIWKVSLRKYNSASS